MKSFSSIDKYTVGFKIINKAFWNKLTTFYIIPSITIANVRTFSMFWHCDFEVLNPFNLEIYVTLSKAMSYGPA